MGSLRYARACRKRDERIVGMLSLETIGYYSDEQGSQRFDSCPPLRLIYPSTGDFIAFVADTTSADLARRVVAGLERVLGELAEEQTARGGGVTAGPPR